MKPPFLLFVASTLLFSCGDGHVVTLTDPEDQRKIDYQAISDYLREEGYNPATVDATVKGVRFLIIEKGDGAEIDESDIVTFHYTGSLTSGEVFDTSIDAVYEENKDVLLEKDENKQKGSPFSITYSASAWTYDIFVPGFTDGIANTFHRINEGGHVRIFLPSELGYGTKGRLPFIQPNTVLIFDIYPTKVRKQ